MLAASLGNSLLSYQVGAILLSCLIWFPSIARSTEQSVYECTYASSADPAQHELFLQSLNGTRILFIGDTVTRSQYLTLSSFLTKGFCPDKETTEREAEYNILFNTEDSNHMYRESSKLLNTPISVESCFCIEGELEPDARSFTYEDDQGIRIQLEYMQYMNETMRRFKYYMQTALNMRPTHVVLNFGLELLHTNEDCGDHENDKECPYIQTVCEFMKAEQPFRILWQTSTPKLVDAGNILGSIGEEHHMHVPKRCELDPASVLNRVEILHALEPDQDKRVKLFDDHLHLSPGPYHAFNGRLIDMITS